MGRRLVTQVTLLREALVAYLFGGLNIYLF